MDKSKGLLTPLPPGIKLPDLEDISDNVRIEKYRRLLGKLLYVSRCVRYDIYFAVDLLARYSTKHNKMIWKLLKGILRYISTNESYLHYKYADRTTAESTITAWSNASFGDDPSTKKSTIGNLITWNNYIIA